MSDVPSSWRATRDLDAYLRAEGVTGIAVRGTRLLTRRVREQGAMRAAISTVETSGEKLLERVLASPQMTGADLARVVSTPEPYTVPADGPAFDDLALDLLDPDLAAALEAESDEHDFGLPFDIRNSTLGADVEGY